ncbi:MULTISPECIES: UDP-N-acetylmuramoyl-tripeptide--D-alanyl-D-alanine ligase [unclassified Desulfovibrio]|uniref:UDP-N-acetylmuramoyl-tripeptide--D-alanyl-D- alanine ligase n=1 Tax=unclassified Desulfovibrio TaxID=2593640 RepID=UPI0019812AA3|nr:MULTISPECIES: UDP-N-acetylmuramoyl-tripeptide--D-alanyl-D-alanine ligase [unclassified Desulfovibrio]
MTVGEMAQALGLPAEACAGHEGRVLARAVTDSREAAPGALFVCVPGARVDGHDFAASAVERGAGAVLASRPLPEVTALSVPVLVVPDTVKALGRLAAHWRDRTAAKVVCVTGTAGKTTLKEALAAILAVRGKTAKTPLNHNNQIGMPCAVLDTDGDEDFWVMEAGISHEGDMDELAAILRPDLAVILNVGPGHTEGLGGKGVAWHKARLLAHLAPGGTALVSADYADLVAEPKALGVSPVFFSTVQGRAPYTAAMEDGAAGRCRLELAGESFSVDTPFRGAFGAENAIAAAAAAHLLGLSEDEICRGFAEAPLPPRRSARKELGPWRVIDDTYNANPLSMRRMLEAAAEEALGAGLPLAAVLGEMGELGAESARHHAELGRLLGRLGVDAVYWKGGHGEDVRAGLVAENPHTAPRWTPVTGPEDFVRAWVGEERFPDGAVVLFKGSRANRLEELLAALEKAQAGQGREERRVL